MSKEYNKKINENEDYVLVVWIIILGTSLKNSECFSLLGDNELMTTKKKGKLSIFFKEK